MPDGTVYRDHVLALECKGVDTGELTPPPIPAGYEDLLELFWELRRQAGSTGMAHIPIACSHVLAWQSLLRVQLTPDEVDLIFKLDAAALAAFAANAEAKKPIPTK